MLEKPKGGFRPVLLCAGPVRVWERLRRPTLQEFEVISSRKYWGLGAGKAPQELVWLQAARSEAAVAKGHVAAGLLWDAAKYYESFVLLLLRRRALLAGIPPVIVKVTYNLWSGPRIVRLGMNYSTTLLFARCGLPAGDIFNDAFVKAYALEPFDRFVVRNPLVKLVSFVDDDTLTHCGPEAEVQQVLVEAAEDFHEVLTDELHVSLSQDKLATVASSMQVAKRLHMKLCPSYAGRAAASAENLGVDFCPGGRRAAKGGCTKRRKRFQRLALRQIKLCRIRRSLAVKKARMGSIYIVGARPAATYGSAVQGVSEAELRQLRRTLLQGRSPRRGASLTLRLALWGDPAADAAFAPAVLWVQLLWKASCRHSQASALATTKELRDLWWAAAPEEATANWANSKWSMRRAVLSLRRAGWTVKEPFVWIDERGLEVRLVDHSPAMVQTLLRESLQRSHERGAARKLYGQSCCQTCAVDHVVTKFLNSSKYTALQKYFVNALATLALWTRDRLRLSRYDTDGLCEFCGAPDTVFHRLWGCRAPAVAAARDAVVPPMVVNLARDTPEDPMWTTGLFLMPEDGGGPAPLLDDGGLVFKDAQGNIVDQREWHPTAEAVAGDGSCYPHVIKALSRAGWSLLFFNPTTGEQEHSVHGPVWSSLPQTSQAGEHVSYVALLKLIQRKVRAHHVDCRAVESMHRQPLAKQLRATSKYAGVWRSALVQKDPSEAVEQVCWTKAHRSKGVIDSLPTAERVVAYANAAVDDLAKAGAKLHPEQDHDFVKVLDAKLAQASYVFEVAMAVLPLFSVQKFDLLPKALRNLPSGAPSAAADLESPATSFGPAQVPVDLVPFDFVQASSQSEQAAANNFQFFRDSGHVASDRGQCRRCYLSVHEWVSLGKPECLGEHKVVSANRARQLKHVLQRIDLVGSFEP